jgi:uncharacterized membrane protein
MQTAVEQSSIEHSPGRVRVREDARTAPVVITAIALACGIALRWSFLGTNSLWFDEGYTAWVVSNPVAGPHGIVHIIAADTAPPLYYILLRGWTNLFGHSEAGLRSMSALFGCVSLLVFAMICRRLVKTPWPRATAIVLFSIAFMQLAYAHEARFYAMMTMLGAIDLYLVLRVCDRSSGWGLGALVLAWSASLYTNNVMAVYLACVGLAWLVLPGRRPVRARLRDAAMVSMTTALVFAPWVPEFLVQARRVEDEFWPTVPDLWMLARTIGMLCGIHEQSLWHGDWHNFLQVDVGLLLIVLLACRSRRQWRAAVGLVIFGIAPILLIFVYSHLRRSIFMERAFLPSGLVMPLLLAIAMEGARTVPVRALIALLAAIAFGLSMASLPGRWIGSQSEGWRDACEYAKSDASGTGRRLTICVANEGEFLFDYYARHGDYSPSSDLTGVPRSVFACDPPRTLQRVKTDGDIQPIAKLLASGGYTQVTLISSHVWWGDGDHRTLNLLRQNCVLIEQRQFDQIIVYRFRCVSPRK